MSKKDSINKQLTLGEKTGLRNAIRNTRDMALRYPRGADGLTEKQRIFVEIYTANEGRLTPTECARQSGYKQERAATTASELLNVKTYPKVVNAVMKRRDEISETHKVEMNKHVQELARLRDKALGEKSYSAAVNAERLRGQAAGLYIDRKEIRTGSIDSMSREEVLSKLKEIGLDGKFRKEKKGVVLEIQEKKSNSKGIKDITEMETKSSKGQEGL
jgi:phage terminase small subunit